MKAKPVKVTDDKGNVSVYPSILKAGIGLNLSITTVRNCARYGKQFQLPDKSIRIEFMD